MAEEPQEKTTSEGGFYTPKSLGTVAGSAALLALIMDAVVVKWPPYPGWAPMALGLLFALIAQQIAQRRAGAGAPREPILARAMMVVVNGILIYTTALGVASATSEEVEVVIEGKKETVGLSPWKPLFPSPPPKGGSGPGHREGRGDLTAISEIKFKDTVD
jgi:hypothetical protein